MKAVIRVIPKNKKDRRIAKALEVLMNRALEREFKKFIKRELGVK